MQELVLTSMSDEIINLNNCVANLSIEELVKQSIVKDLLDLNWSINFFGQDIKISPPKEYNKEIIKSSMARRRDEIILANKSWIDDNMSKAQMNLARGADVLKSKIQPRIEVCETQKQHDLFRLFRYYWSSPYSDYVGRRIKLLVRDYSIANKPIIGIAALGSPIIHIPERDSWVGWNKNQRTKNLVYSLDAYVVGALPPYNLILGGKLMSYILASNEVRKIYFNKYKNKVSLISKRKANSLACIFTTSLYGRSAQYNRIKLNSHSLYERIGETKGFGTLHLSEKTFSLMVLLVKSKNKVIDNNFGSGPSWRMRVIRAAGDILGFDSDILLCHSFKRDIYAVQLASNTREFLKDNDAKLQYYNWHLKDIVSFWRERWLTNRLGNPEIYQQVKSYLPESFSI
jgi:hypothetical protein